MSYKTAAFHLMSLVLSTGLAAPALAGSGSPSPLDLTGTWTGTASYKGLGVDGTSFKFTEEITLYMVTDTDGHTAMTAESTGGDPTAVARGLVDAEGFCLLAVQAAGKPGKGLATGGVATAGGPGVVYDPDLPIEGVNFKASKVEGSEGKLAGKAVMLPWLGARAGTATIKVQRTDAAAPVLDSDLTDACLVSVAP